MLGSKNTQPARFGVVQGPVQGGLACLLHNVWGARGRAGIQLTCWGACGSASPPPLPPTNSGRFGLPGDAIDATLLPGAAHCPPLTATLTAPAAPVLLALPVQCADLSVLAAYPQLSSIGKIISGE